MVHKIDLVNSAVVNEDFTFLICYTDNKANASCLFELALILLPQATS